jgi:hypothetical protein
MSKIIIQLQGGLVQDVFLRGTGKVNGYITVDEDYEGADDEEITKVEIIRDKTPDTYEAVCGGPYKLGDLPKGSDVDKMVTAFLKEKKS